MGGYYGQQQLYSELITPSPPPPPVPEYDYYGQPLPPGTTWDDLEPAYDPADESGAIAGYVLRTRPEQRGAAAPVAPPAAAPPLPPPPAPGPQLAAGYGAAPYPYEDQRRVDAALAVTNAPPPLPLPVVPPPYAGAMPVPPPTGPPPESMIGGGYPGTYSDVTGMDLAAPPPYIPPFMGDVRAMPPPLEDVRAAGSPWFRQRPPSYETGDIETARTQREYQRALPVRPPGDLPPVYSAGQPGPFGAGGETAIPVGRSVLGEIPITPPGAYPGETFASPDSDVRDAIGRVAAAGLGWAGRNVVQPVGEAAGEFGQFVAADPHAGPAIAALARGGERAIEAIGQVPVEDVSDLLPGGTLLTSTLPIATGKKLGDTTIGDVAGAAAGKIGEWFSDPGAAVATGAELIMRPDYWWHETMAQMAVDEIKYGDPYRTVGQQPGLGGLVTRGSEALSGIPVIGKHLAEPTMEPFYDWLHDPANRDLVLSIHTNGWNGFEGNRALWEYFQSDPGAHYGDPLSPIIPDVVERSFQDFITSPTMIAPIARGATEGLSVAARAAGRPGLLRAAQIANVPFKAADIVTSVPFSAAEAIPIFRATRRQMGETLTGTTKQALIETGAARRAGGAAPPPSGGPGGGPGPGGGGPTTPVAVAQPSPAGTAPTPAQAAPAAPVYTVQQAPNGQWMVVGGGQPGVPFPTKRAAQNAANGANQAAAQAAQTVPTPAQAATTQAAQPVSAVTLIPAGGVPADTWPQYPRGGDWEHPTWANLQAPPRAPQAQPVQRPPWAPREEPPGPVAPVPAAVAPAASVPAAAAPATPDIPVGPTVMLGGRATFAVGQDMDVVKHGLDDWRVIQKSGAGGRMRTQVGRATSKEEATRIAQEHIVGRRTVTTVPTPAQVAPAPSTVSPQAMNPDDVPVGPPGVSIMTGGGIMRTVGDDMLVLERGPGNWHVVQKTGAGGRMLTKVDRADSQEEAIRIAQRHVAGRATTTGAPTPTQVAPAPAGPMANQPTPRRGPLAPPLPHIEARRLVGLSPEDVYLGLDYRTVNDYLWGTGPDAELANGMTASQFVDLFDQRIIERGERFTPGTTVWRGADAVTITAQPGQTQLLRGYTSVSPLRETAVRYAQALYGQPNSVPAIIQLRTTADTPVGHIGGVRGGDYEGDPFTDPTPPVQYVLPRNTTIRIVERGRFDEAGRELIVAEIVPAQAAPAPSPVQVTPATPRTAMDQRIESYRTMPPDQFDRDSAARRDMEQAGSFVRTAVPVDSPRYPGFEAYLDVISDRLVRYPNETWRYINGRYPGGSRRLTGAVRNEIVRRAAFKAVRQGVPSPSSLVPEIGESLRSVPSGAGTPTGEMPAAPRDVTGPEGRRPPSIPELEGETLAQRGARGQGVGDELALEPTPGVADLRAAYVARETAAAEATVRQRLAEHNLSDVNVRVGPNARGERGTYNAILDRITVALQRGDDMIETVDHEIVHALRQRGVLRSAEWDTLGRAAADTTNPVTGNRFLDDAQDLYGGQGGKAGRTADELVREEAIAQMYAVYRQNPAHFALPARTALDRVANFFRSFLDTFRGRNPGDARAIMDRIASGEVAGRPRGAPPRFASPTGTTPGTLAQLGRRTAEEAAYDIGTVPSPSKGAAIGRAFGFGGRMPTPDVPGKYSALLNVDLGPTTEARLATKIGAFNLDRAPKAVRGREVAEVWDPIWRDLEAARTASAKPIATRTVADKALIDRVAILHGLDRVAADSRVRGIPMENADAIAKLDNQAADELAAEAGIQPLRKEYGLDTKTWWEKGLTPIDWYNTTTRQNQLLGNATAARYIMFQWLGNPVTGIFGGVSPRTLGKAMATPRRGFRSVRAEALQPGDPYLVWLQRHGKAPSPDITQFKSAMTATQTGKPSDRQGTWVSSLVRKVGALGNAARVIHNPEARDIANGIDFTFRTMTAGDAANKAEMAMNRALLRHAKDTARVRTLPVTSDAIDTALAPILARGGTRTSRAIRDALEGLGTGTKKPGAFTDWARRVGADWEEAAGEVQRIAETDSTRVFFSGRETRADAVMNRIFSFHYWATRATRVYVEQGLRNPALMAAYGRSLDWMERNADPKWKQFIQGMKLPEGWLAFWSPIGLGAALITWSEEGRDPLERGRTEAGQRIANIPIGLSGAADMLRFFSGKTGEEYAPNPWGVASDMLSYSALLNSLADHGRLPGQVVEREISRMNANPNDWWAEKAAAARQWLFRNGDWVPDLPMPPGAFARAELNDLIAEEVRTRYQTWDAEAQAEYDEFVREIDPAVPESAYMDLFLKSRVLAALHDPTSDAWIAADRRQSDKDAAKAAYRAFLPSYVKSRLESTETMKPLLVAANAANDSFEDEDEITAAEAFASYLDDITGVTDPRTQELMYDVEVRKAIINDPVAKPVFDVWMKIRDGSITESVTVYDETGQAYTFDAPTIASMTEEERRDLADQWAVDAGYLYLIRDYQYNLETYERDHPETSVIKDVAYAYGGGTDPTANADRWIADTRKVNPAYDRFVSEIDANPKYDDEAVRDIVLSWRGYAVLQGYGGSVYETPTTDATGVVAGGKKVTALPSEVAAGRAWPADPERGFVSTEQDIADYQKVDAWMQAQGWGPASEYWNLPPGTSLYDVNPALWKALKGEFKTIPDSRYGEIAAGPQMVRVNPQAEGYLLWLASQSGSPSLDTWLRSDAYLQWLHDRPVEEFSPTDYGAYVG